MCCVHSFFLKPLSVTLPFAARFTEGEAASRARERTRLPGENKKRDSWLGGEEGNRWRGF
jgi:hypothetical protein